MTVVMTRLVRLHPGQGGKNWGEVVKLLLLAALLVGLPARMSAAADDGDFDPDAILGQVRNLRLTLVVETNADLTQVAQTAVFRFQFRAQPAPVFFFFPGVEAPDQFRGLWVNGKRLAASALLVRRHPVYDTTVFLLPARYLPRTQQPITLRVQGPWQANPQPHYTHWGSWHAYLLSRAVPVPIRMEVRVPSAWDVVCSGKPMRDGVRDGQRVAVWTSGRPQGWMFLSIAHYRRRDLDLQGMKFTVWWPKEQTDFDPGLVTRRPFDILAFYRREFGPSDTPTAALIEVPEDHLNNFAVNGLVVITRGSYAEIQRNPDYLEAMLAHELAHFWWGATVSPEGPGARWLSEGLAEYSRALYEQARGLEPLPWTYRNLVVVRQFADAPPPALAGPETYGEDETIYYQKGSFVFRTFAELVGAARFEQVLRSFLDQYHGRQASVNQFVQVADRVAQGQYQWFFDQWLTRRTGPKLRLEDVRAASADSTFTVTGTLVQEGEPYRLRVPLRLCSGPNACQDQVLNVEGQRTAFRFDSAKAPLRITVDPAGEIFKWFPKSALPMDFAGAYARLKADPGVAVVGGESVFHNPQQEAAFRQWLEKSWKAQVKPGSDNRVLLGKAAEEYRQAHAVPGGEGPPPDGTLRVFVARNPEAPDGFILGMEGDLPADWNQVVIPEAPLTSMNLSDGKIVGAYATALPKIEFRWPAHADAQH